MFGSTAGVDVRTIQGVVRPARPARFASQEAVSYSKMLLISRIIYFCRLTSNESFTFDSSSLKGVLKQYGDFDFNQRHPKTYEGGLKLPKEEGE